VVGQPALGGLEPGRQAAATAATDITVVLGAQAIGGQAGDQVLDRIGIDVEFHELIGPICHEAAHRSQMGIPFGAPERAKLILTAQAPHTLLPLRELAMAMLKARADPVLPISPIQQQDRGWVVAQDLAKQAVAIETETLIAVDQIAIENGVLNPGKHWPAGLEIGAHDAAQLAATAGGQGEGPPMRHLLMQGRMTGRGEELGQAAGGALVETDRHHLWQLCHWLHEST